MDISIKDIDQTKKEIKAEIPFEEFKKFIEQATVEAVKNFEAKGFRKGQAPKEMVVREVGQDKILTQAAGLVVEDCYPQIIKENNLEPLGPPKVDVLKLALDNPLEFRAEIFVLPKIKLPDYKKIAGQIKKQDIVVEDKEVEELLKQLKDVKDKLPEEQQDKINFEKPEGLKKTLHSQIEAEKKGVEQQRIRSEILKQVSKECSWPIPEILVLAEKQRALTDLKKKVSENLKMTFEDYLKKIKKTEKELDELMRKEIIEKLKRILILGEIQKLEKIESSQEELEKEIKAFLEHPANKEIKQDIDQNRLKSYLKERIEQEKTLQFLEGLAK